MLAKLRSAASWLRHTPDRLLHPRRRARLLRQLSSGPLPGSVLFVCLGNICRSPYAAAVLEHVLPPELRSRIRISSAGFLAAGRTVPTPGQKVAASKGIDLSAHRSTALMPSAAAEADLIVVMEAGQQRHICKQVGRSPQDVIVLGDLDPEPIRKRTIVDPFDKPEEVFSASYARIDRCVAELAGAFAAGGPSRRSRRHRPSFRPVLPDTAPPESSRGR